jgi:hypothetical protein
MGSTSHVPEGHTVEYYINPPKKEPSEGYLRALKRDLRKAIQEALEETDGKKTEYDTRFARAREQSFDLNALLDKLDSVHKFIFCLSFGFFSSDEDLTAEFRNGSKKLFNRYIREIEDAITEIIEESEKRDEGLDEILHSLSFSNAWDVQEETGTRRLNKDPLQIPESANLHEVTLSAYHDLGEQDDDSDDHCGRISTRYPEKVTTPDPADPNPKSRWNRLSRDQWKEQDHIEAMGGSYVDPVNSAARRSYGSTVLYDSVLDHVFELHKTRKISEDEFGELCQKLVRLQEETTALKKFQRSLIKKHGKPEKISVIQFFPPTIATTLQGDTTR